MTVTIYEGYDKSYIMLGSTDNRFRTAWGSVYKVPVSNLYQDLRQIKLWCENKLGEELILEVN